MYMRDLQQLLKKFLSREIELVELQSGFRRLLRDDEELAVVAAAWLEAGERDGRLSAAVCAALKDVLVSHMASSNLGPNPVDSGIFETLVSERRTARLAKQSKIAEPPRPEPPPDKDTAVREQTDARSAPTPADLDTGSVVSGRYELLELLGEGGMGRVFKARDRLRAKAQDRKPFIALKVLSEQFREHPDSMIALQREAQRAQSLAHPNVITVHEFFEDGPHFYMTMELLRGEPLDRLVKTTLSGGIPMSEAWPIIQGIGRALHYGHQKNIVHSDVKPGNVFVCDDGTIKVLDLGISRPMPKEFATDSDQTVFDPGKRLGGLTPGYAALEMWSREKPDPRDDVYALACVSYLLLSGRHPFDGKSAKQAFEQGLEPKRIDTITRGQWRALKSGLALTRPDRTRSVAEFLAQIDPQTVVHERQKTMGIASGITLIAALAIGGWWYGGLREQQALDELDEIENGSPSPVERPVLNDQQMEMIANLGSLAELQMESVQPRMSASELIYLLSSGPNNVREITDTILRIDPGDEKALDYRQRAAETLINRARGLLGEGDLDSAKALRDQAAEFRTDRRALRSLTRDIAQQESETSASQR